MRHLSFTLLSLAAIVFSACGCRQTNGTTAGPLSPLGGLSPVAPGQTPLLGPFGSSTRVTPPPTGSFSPNGTLGAVAPTPGYGPAANYAPQVNAGAFNQPFGSGVQPVSGFNQPAMNQHANWTETGTTIPAGGSSQGRDPRAGGMQIIDLTGAPNPPNYRPTNFGPANSGAANFQSTQANGTGSLVISPNLLPAQPISRSSLPTQTSALFPSTSPQFESRGAASPLPNASTARLPDQSNDNSLNWRRPGTQF